MQQSFTPAFFQLFNKLFAVLQGPQVTHTTETDMSADESEKRFFKQGTWVVGSAAVTITAALLSRRSVRARMYRPKTFEANHIPPKFNMTKDAAYAMVDATLLSTGFFAFGVASTCWLMDVSSFEQFGRKMKAYWGAEEREKQVLKEADKEIDEAVQTWFK